jgi:hypothetical protein
MSSRTLSIFGGSVFALALAVGALQSCGGGSSSTDYASLCMKGCAKTVACLADAGFTETQSACEQTCNSSTKTTCTNQTAIVNAYNACLSDSDCTTFQACVEAVPPCEGGSSGSGGTGSGGTGAATGGTTGAGGTGTGAGGTIGTGGTGTGAGGTTGTGGSGTGTGGTTGAGGTAATGGKGGTTGAGGTTASGGTGGSVPAACSNCVKLDACCTAGTGTSCGLAAICAAAATGPAQTADESICTSTLQAEVSAGTCSM